MPDCSPKRKNNVFILKEGDENVFVSTVFTKTLLESPLFLRLTVYILTLVEVGWQVPAPAGDFIPVSYWIITYRLKYKTLI